MSKTSGRFERVPNACLGCDGKRAAPSSQTQREGRGYKREKTTKKEKKKKNAVVWITLRVVKLIRLAKNFNAAVDNKTKQSLDDKSELDHKTGSRFLELDAPFPLHSKLVVFFFWSQ